MVKRIISVMLTLVVSFSLVGCGSDNGKGGTNGGGTKNNVKIKTVDDFTESTGQIKYFTVEDKKFAIPETVGEYVNYLKQIGKVTLGADEEDVNEATLDAGKMSAYTAYLNVELDNGDVAWFGCAYENNTDDTLTVAECSITQLQFKYDLRSEQENEKVIKSIVFITDQDKEVPLNFKLKMQQVARMLGTPIQNTDGRLTYKDHLGNKIIWDCCNENTDGTFRGLIIKYPTK